MLTGRKVLLGVTGSIAAYKAALVTRLLVQQGAEVQVVMTPAAHDFITPLTLSTLSRQPVLTRTHDKETGEWARHVDLALAADVILIAPASANTLAKMANGQCDNLLLTIYMSARCPVFFAPAMDMDMLQHDATQRNIESLLALGHHLIEPGTGELASGLSGPGRMAEPETIVGALDQFFASNLPLSGKRALVTAGPTYEAIDPVRFIGNHSSGKMGYAIAEELARQGATVDLVSGPTRERTSLSGISVHPVTSADEMFSVCDRLFASADITVLSAAVADYKPATEAKQKIKKSDAPLQIDLVKTPDIAATLGKRKNAGQVLVGFALETENEHANAVQKLRNKNMDMIVLNSLRDAGAGFGGDTNKVEIIFKDGSSESFSLKDKRSVAKDIVQALTHVPA